MLKNKKALSHKEQEIYFTLSNSSNRIFTLEMLKAFKFTDYNTLKELLSSMAKKGWFTRIKRGIYYLNAPGAAGIEDVFNIATYLYDGYVAFSSALYIYHAITERPYTIYVATRRESRSKRFGNIEIKAVSLNERAVGITRYEGYSISTRAKTLYDCFHIPDYAGGYSKIVEAVYSLNLSAKEWEEFLGYVDNFEADSAKRKIGYTLEIANKAGSRVPLRIINSLMINGSIIKFGRGKSGKYIRKWKLFDYLGEDYLLGWTR